VCRVQPRQPGGEDVRPALLEVEVGKAQRPARGRVGEPAVKAARLGAVVAHEARDDADQQRMVAQAPEERRDLARIAAHVEPAQQGDDVVVAQTREPQMRDTLREPARGRLERVGEQPCADQQLRRPAPVSARTTSSA
jgi:hypothetical protein